MNSILEFCVFWFILTCSRFIRLWLYASLKAWHHHSLGLSDFITAYLVLTYRTCFQSSPVNVKTFHGSFFYRTSRCSWWLDNCCWLLPKFSSPLVRLWSPTWVLLSIVLWRRRQTSQKASSPEAPHQKFALGLSRATLWATSLNTFSRMKNRYYHTRILKT